MEGQPALQQIIRDIPRDLPVLIAGPTASGKSALALAIAEAQGGTIVNADALQVYQNWRILTARPGPEDVARAPHALYGHVPGDQTYSVGHWLREVAPYLAPYLSGGARPIIVGGTGLNFTALTRGLADIPDIAADIRAAGEALLAKDGLAAMVKALDEATRARIDTQNPARIIRAWEVLRATGRGLADWQDQTPPPLLPLTACTPIVFVAERDWLRARITARFDAMLAAGALAEVRANMAHWTPAAPSAKAIGARELMAHLGGEISLEDARERAIIASRQYAKRQQSWFRARMQAQTQGWQHLALP